MSVLIKDMQMPKSCKTCDLLQDDDGDMYCPFGDCPVFGDIEYVPNHVASDICPLVELPEHHGRLIDADVLATESLKDSAYGYVSTKQIYDAETILEAE